MTTEFSTAKMDGTTKMVTIIVSLLLLSLPLLSLLLEPPKLIVSATSFILLYGVIVISYGFIPKIIEVSRDQILIKNLYGPVIININQIDHFQKIEKIGMNIKTFGVGGLFGYFGYFNGGEVWYVTNTQKKVRIVLKTGKTYVISPENPDDFVKVVHDRFRKLNEI